MAIICQFIFILSLYFGCHLNSKQGSVISIETVQRVTRIILAAQTQSGIDANVRNEAETHPVGHLSAQCWFLDMSRTSADQYHIPLRSLGRGRRKPARSFSNLSHRYTELDVEDRGSTDEAPLIHKDDVLLTTVWPADKVFSTLMVPKMRDPFADFLGLLAAVNRTSRAT